MTIYYIDQVDAPVPGSEANYSILNWPRSKSYPGCVRITTIDEACGSDYSGGSHTRSNFDVIADSPELAPHVIRLHGTHGSYGIAYVGDLEDQPEALRDAVAALADYPILDDDAHSEHELQLETEAWSEAYGGAHDFRKALTVYLDEIDDAWEHDADKITDDELWHLWRDGCDAFNVNGGSGHVIETGELVHFYIDEWFEKCEPGKLNKRYYHCKRIGVHARKARTEAKPGVNPKLDTCIENIVSQLSRLLVTLCGYDANNPHELAGIQFSTDFVGNRIRANAWIHLECHAEDTRPEDELDEEQARAVRADMDSGNEWAWCRAAVRVAYHVGSGETFYADRGTDRIIERTSWLGGCSYANAEDFRQSGYYEDMVTECVDEIKAELERRKAQANSYGGE